MGTIISKNNKLEQIKHIKQKAESCNGCELCKTRTTVVFGTGSHNAKIMLIGEAPGRKEDEGGEPFVGKAGQFLNELLDEAGLKREDTYIANVLKCRPPKNRNPKPCEINSCGEYLWQQIKIIEPLVIIPLGNFATNFILDTKEPISKLHGSVKEIQKDGKSIKVCPMFHPAAAIYDRSKIELLKTDFTNLKQYL